MQKITPCLWYSNNGEEAVAFYHSIFPGKVLEVMHHTEHSPGKPGTVLSMTFTLFGQEFMLINGGEKLPYNNSVSFMVACDTQEEIDRVWNALLEGGKPNQCGWLNDKYGVPWQVTPPILPQMLRDPNKAKADAVMQAMMKMVKIDIATLKKAYAEA